MPYDNMYFYSLVKSYITLKMFSGTRKNSLLVSFEITEFNTILLLLKPKVQNNKKVKCLERRKGNAN